jgi:hypothetical protein
MKPRLFPPGGVGIVVNSWAIDASPACQTKKSIGFTWHVMDRDWYEALLTVSSPLPLPRLVRGERPETLTWETGLPERKARHDQSQWSMVAVAVRCSVLSGYR